MIRLEFVSEMRLNSVSPSLDTSEIMKSDFLNIEGKRGRGGRVLEWGFNGGGK